MTRRARSKALGTRSHVAEFQSDQAGTDPGRLAGTTLLAAGMPDASRSLL